MKEWMKGGAGEAFNSWAGCSFFCGAAHALFV
jgi:hypothetical protein